MITLNEQQQTVVNEIVAKITSLNASCNPMVVSLTDAQVNSVTYDLSSLINSLIRDGVIDNLTDAINNNSYSLALDSYKFYNYNSNSMTIFATIKNSHIEPMGSDIDIIKVNIDVVASTSSLTINSYDVYLQVTPSVTEIEIIS